MVRVSKVSVVEEPHISDVRNLVIRPRKELVEVLNWLNQVGQPNHCGQIWVSSLDELSSKSNLIIVLLMSCLYSIEMNFKVLMHLSYYLRRLVSRLPG